MSHKKYFLFKASDGTRGQRGKKKIYTVTVDGIVVTTNWGKAETGNLRSQVFSFSSERAALEKSRDIVRSKMQRGYSLDIQV